MKNAGKACNNRLYRHIRTFEKIVKNYFVIYYKQEDFFVVLWKKPRYYGMVIYIGRSLQSDFCEREEKHEPYY